MQHAIKDNQGINIDELLNLRERSSKCRNIATLFLSASIFSVLCLLLYIFSQTNIQDIIIEGQDDTSTKVNSIKKNLDSVKIQISLLHSNTEKIISERKNDSIDKFIENQNNEIERLNKIISEFDIDNYANNNIDFQTVLSKSVLHVSIILAFYFLIQILLKYYKYNIEKADFYTALGDTFDFAKDFGIDTKDLSYNEILTFFKFNSNLEIPNSPNQ